MASALLPKSAIDRRLLDAAQKIGHSAEDLSEAVNAMLTPAQALARVKEMLGGIAAYDENEQRKLLLIRMSQWVDDLMEAHGTSSRTIGGINRALKLVSDQLERSSMNVNEVSTKLSQAHANYFVTGFMKGFELAMKRAQEASGEILDAEVIDDIMQESVKAAHHYVETVTAKAIA
jgi:hypothetical protein